MYAEIIQQILVGFALIILCSVSDGVSARSLDNVNHNITADNSVNYPKFIIH